MVDLRFMTVFVLSTVAVGKDEIIMKVLYGQTESDPKDVTFSTDLFSNFYNCLRGDSTSRCNVKTDGNYIVNNVTSVTNTQPDTNGSPCYNCTIPESGNLMVCERQPPNDGAERTTFFTLKEQAAECCVGIVWNKPPEGLNPNQGDLQSCQSQCQTVPINKHSTQRAMLAALSTTFTPNVGIATSKRIPNGLHSTRLLTSTDRSSAPSLKTVATTTLAQDMQTPGKETQSSDDNIYLIIGLVVGILAVTVISFAVFIVLWIQRRAFIDSENKTENGLENTVFTSKSGPTMNSKHRYFNTIVPPEEHHTNEVEHVSEAERKQLTCDSQQSARPAVKSYVEVQAVGALKVFESEREATVNNNKSISEDATHESIIKTSEKASIVPKELLRLSDSDEFGYTRMVEAKVETDFAQPNQAIGQRQDLQESQRDQVVAKRGEELSKNTVPVNVKINVTSDSSNIDRDYELAQIAEGKDRSASPKPRVSASDSFGYYQIHDCGSTDEQFSLTPDNKSRCGGQLFCNDYEYVSGTYQDGAIPKTTIDTQVIRTYLTTSNVDKDHQNNYNDNYSTISETSPGSTEVYSKLGEKRREITNPYNILLQPKQDPKTRKLLPEPAHFQECNSKQSNHFSAQLGLNRSTTPIEIVQVKPHSGRSVDSPIHQTNIPETPQGNPMPDYAVVKEKNTSKEETNLYFELEKEEDVQNANNDAEAVDYAMVKKKDKLTDKQEAGYELENEPDATITNKNIPDYAVVKRKDK